MNANGQSEDASSDWKSLLKSACCDLIMLGHKDVFRYGYSFFKLACKRAREFEKKQILGATTSIGLAFSGKKDFQKFLQEYK